jgi:hypothetical protein
MFLAFLFLSTVSAQPPDVSCVEQLSNVLREASCHIQITTLSDIKAEVYACVAREIDPNNSWMTHPYYIFKLSDVPTPNHIQDNGYSHVCEDDEVHIFYR